MSNLLDRSRLNLERAIANAALEVAIAEERVESLKEQHRDAGFEAVVKRATLRESVTALRRHDERRKQKL